MVLVGGTSRPGPVSQPRRFFAQSAGLRTDAPLKGTDRGNAAQSNATQREQRLAGASHIRACLAGDARLH
jgi:hypothetical protein